MSRDWPPSLRITRMANNPTEDPNYVAPPMAWAREGASEGGLARTPIFASLFFNTQPCITKLTQNQLMRLFQA